MENERDILYTSTVDDAECYSYAVEQRKKRKIIQEMLEIKNVEGD